ncbi:UDP-Glc:alpha-D-GlcNAc-diphosphoundecaprenol beta-1,3-glucosyltransferase WfgD [Methylobacterium brachiatum]|jgi:glycosyltransferase involved in cell wall biosynthesis|nr:UDP-Glc:alpha-D-GlcNAc-diphosphoundecaprenol beta-1,3-glucosyltransferase WfgD [Methylobacterium brachiatum]
MTEEKRRFYAPVTLKKRPRFSFVVPVYDRKRVVRECLLSCLRQTFDDFEIIVVFDGSPAETRDYLSEICSHRKIKIFSYAEPFGTACRARNRGIQEASGEYICLLDSDDLSNSTRLETVESLITQTNSDVIYGSIRFLVDAGRIVPGISFGDIAEPNQNGFTLADLIAANQIYTLSASIKREKLLKFGGFRLEMRYREDYELWLRLKYRGATFSFTNAVLSIYRIHGGNNELNFKDNDSHWYNKAIESYKKPFVSWGS